jgi:predicted DNA-binding transcriptional regulator AlpA
MAGHIDINTRLAAHEVHLAPQNITPYLERLEAILQTFQRSPVLDEAIRLPEVLSIVGLSKSTWYARLNARLPGYDARAPKPFKLGTSDRSPTAWWRSEVMAYVLACAAAQPAH